MREPEREARECLASHWGDAVHEAGHAVTAYLLGWQIECVSLIPSGETLGRTTYIPRDSANTEPASGASTQKRIEEDAQIALAGMIAEELFVGRADPKRSQNDTHSITDKLAFLVGWDEQGLIEYRHQMRIQARRHLRAHESAIIALAIALCRSRRLQGEVVHSIIQTALSQLGPCADREHE